jgi:hypothetical protein
MDGRQRTPICLSTRSIFALFLTRGPTTPRDDSSGDTCLILSLRETGSVREHFNRLLNALKVKTNYFSKSITDPGAALREMGVRAALHDTVSFLAVPHYLRHSCTSVGANVARKPEAF